MASEELINSIKLLLYKEKPSLFENLDFEDDEIFQEPLLFAYFNSKIISDFNIDLLEEILFGYTIKRKFQPIKFFNNENIGYLPKIGYLQKNTDSIFQDIFYIPNTNIELLLHSLYHLKYIFRNFNNEIIPISEIEISFRLTQKYISALINAFQSIRKYSYIHYVIIEKVCKKIILFKTDPKNTNSFATINAHGIAFLNVYQENYDEVFFVDDIAHQTGHIIMTATLFIRKDYFIIDENINIGFITENKSDYRSFYILFHALYTYYTTLMCLNDCLQNSCFDKRQTYEAKGRIGFYLQKNRFDLSIMDDITSHYEGITNVLTNDGINILLKIKEKYSEVYDKWSIEINDFSYENQPYNFSYDDFVKLNPLKNE